MSTPANELGSTARTGDTNGSSGPFGETAPVQSGRADLPPLAADRRRGCQPLADALGLLQDQTGPRRRRPAGGRDLGQTGPGLARLLQQHRPESHRVQAEPVGRPPARL